MLEIPDDPEERERIQREADAVDVYRYRKRFRALGAIGLGALAAGTVWLVLYMIDNGRNPCQRARDLVCAEAPGAPACKMYETILKDSVEDESPKMRSLVRAQCATKLQHLRQGESAPSVR